MKIDVQIIKSCNLKDQAVWIIDKILISGGAIKIKFLRMLNAASKLYGFGVILVRIFPHSD